MSRDRSPLRYTAWLARDVAAGPGLLYLLCVVAFAFVLWRVRVKAGIAGDPVTVQTQTWAAVLTVAALIAAAGMVRTDLKQGFYRAWFSKPMAPWWYYLQRWLLGGLFLLATPVVFGGALVLILGGGTGLSWQLIAVIGLGYLLIGSAVFLLSAFGSIDWLIVFLLAMAERGLHGVASTGIELPGAIEIVYRILPPFHLVDPTMPLPSGRPLLHLAGYGVGLLVAALLVLRFRPLGSGGRA